MTIASEITDLQTNLAAAKTAVENKGGTIGDTGLAGLASEIATIPTGATGSWGTITYLDSNDQERTVTIQNEDEYFLLSHFGTWDVTIGGETFNTSRITSVALGTYATYADAYFLYNCTLLTTITGVENLIFVNVSFLSGCENLNCALNFERLYSMGANFMSGCKAFNTQILLPEAHTIGQRFMSGCIAFAQPFTFNSNITSGSSYIMSDCTHLTSLVINCNPTALTESVYSFSTTDVNAPAYTTGVTISGTYASDFKTRFPNRDTSPYRKLI